MADNNVRVLIKARDQASKKFGHVGRAAGGMGSMLKKAAMAAGVYFGARAIKNFASESLAAFGVQEKAVKGLGDALEQLGARSELKQMEAFASQLQGMSTVGDETTPGLMKLGATIGKLSGDSLQAATVAAIGLSKSLEIDVQTAMRLVSRAAAGDTSTFTRYGVKFAEGATAQEKFQEVLRRGAQDFKLAQGETDTYTGAMAQLSNAWGDFKEMVGGALAGVLPNLIEYFKVAMVGIQNWRTVFSITFKKAELSLIGFWESIKHFFGKTIPDLLAWFGRNWKDVFLNIGSFFKSYFLNMGRNIKNFFVAVWDAIKGKGWHFEWSDLMGDYESHLKEMPKIAARELSNTERALNREIGDLEETLGEKMSAALFPDQGGFDAAALAERATGGAGAGGGGGALAGGGGRSLAATESRFLGTTAARQDPGVAAQIEQTKLARESLKLQQEQVALLRRQQRDTKADTVMGRNTLAMLPRA